MEVYCLQVEYEGIRPSDDYTARTLWSTLEGAKRGLKEERKDILRKPGWGVDSIAIDEDDHFYAVEDEFYRESYRVTIQKETVHE